MDSAKETLSSVQQKASDTVGQVQETLGGHVSLPLLSCSVQLMPCMAQCLASLFVPGSAAKLGLLKEDNDGPQGLV